MTNIENIVSTLPQTPGVYQFYNSTGTIIYIGKAKNLKSRVSSYFNRNKHESFKTKRLVQQVADIKHIIVDSETDALLLENNLIKKLQPKYNVLLKDDKTFPWICIKSEPFPRIFSTRKISNDGSIYYGPYTSAYMVKILINLIRQLYQLRTCSFNLSAENIRSRKFKRCLEYHIGNCKAPCEGEQTADDYNEAIKQIVEILKGNIHDVILHLRESMVNLSSKYRYEEAESVRQKIVLLESYKSKSTIVSPKLNNIDVFSFIEKGNLAYVNFLKIISGAIVQSHSVELHKKLDENKEDLLLFAIVDIRTKVNSTANEIIVPFLPANILTGVKYIVPKIGEKLKLLELSERNAKNYFIQKLALSENNAHKTKTENLLLRLQKDLNLKDLPFYIECFDNSNIQGSNPVAACVVFKNGKPAKSEYRHYNIKTVEGPNDFASMEEIVYRRYKRLMEEQTALPQLVIVDGGKGQLTSAVNSLIKLNIYGKIAIIGIAKRLEELYFPNDPIPLYLDKNSSSLKLIQNLRNEAHRFGITFHRNKRSAQMLTNSLEEIDGIGAKTVEKLYKAFGSKEIVKSKSREEIAAVVGNNMANKLIIALNLE